MTNDYYPNVIKYINEKMGDKPMQRLWDATSIPQGRGSKCLDADKKDRFTLDQMCAIADYFNCSMDELLGRSSTCAPAENAAAVCNFISQLAEEKMLSFSTVSAEEEMHRQLDDVGFDIRHKKGVNQYPGLYFSNYVQPIPAGSTEEDDRDDPIHAQSNFNSAAGNENKTNMIINRFLNQLIQLYVPYSRGIIDKSVFKIAVDALLQKIE